jgi:hypothetical protein
VLQGLAENKKKVFVVSHSALRADATLKVTDFALKVTDVPEGATHFRLLNHISVVSDYSYAELTRKYEPINPLDSESVFKYSEYTSVEASLTAELKAEFPAGTIVGEDCTILQCVGIEFYLPNGVDKYKPATGNSMVMKDVF